MDVDRTAQADHANAGPPVVTARLRPSPEGSTVTRPRLLDALDAGVRHPLTLVAAPAGSGKTVLLSQWARGRPDGTVAWLTLDASDNDRRQFWVDVTSAIARVTGRAAGIGALAPPPEGSMRAFLTAFLNAATARGEDPSAEPLTLVLDDAQEVRSTEVLADVDAVLASCGTGLRVVWVTRVDPPLRLQRLRVADRLGEIRLADLSFTLGEARLLLGETIETLGPADVERLWTTTAGWAVGLRVVALGLRGQRDTGNFVAAFTGGHGQILDYLLDEIVADLPERTIDFLLRTAGVRDVCVPLADALTGARDSAAVLDDLRHRDLLIAPIPGSRERFRYHPLLAEALRVLQRQRIESEIPELHRRAARWYADDGQVVEAIRHASDAGDWSFASALIAEHWMALAIAGNGHSVRAMTTRLPPSTVHDDAEIALAVAGLALADGDEEEGDYFLEVATSGKAALPADRQPRYEVHAAVAQLYLGRVGDDPRHAVNAARRVLDDHWDRDMATALRALARLSVGVAELWMDDLPEAERHIEDGKAFAEDADNTYLTVQALGWSAVVDVMEGRLVEAHRDADASLALAARAGGERDAQAAPALAALAAVLWNWNDLVGSRAMVLRARSAIGLSGRRALRAWISVVEARLHGARGEPETGLRLLRAATADHDGYRLPEPLSMLAHGVEAQLRLRLGEHDRATTLADALTRSGGAGALAAAATVRLGLRDPAEALRITDRLLAAPTIAPPAEIDGWVNRAIAYDMLSSADDAEHALARALDLAEPRGYRRPLLEGGSRIGLVLRRLVRHGTTHRALVGELLESLDGAGVGVGTGTPSRSSAPVPSLAEPLSERELAVLRYMPTTLPYPEVASELFVSVNTIKTHVRHVYRKLDVDNRRDAVARGRELRLLGPTATRS